MLNSMFQKNINTNKIFLEELYKKKIDEQALLDILNSHKVDINYQDENGDTFLHHCLYKLKFKSSLFLIENGIDILLENNNKLNVLVLAVEKENLAVIEAIISKNKIDLDKKYDYSRTLLKDIVINGQNDIAKLFIKYGADINIKDDNNRNLLYDAISYDDEKFIDFLLLQDGLELNDVDIDQDSIMHHPQVIQDDEKAIKLIEAGADTTLQNKNGETYLCNVALKGIESHYIIDKALKFGANINARVGDDKTILMELIAASSKLTDEEQDRRDSLFEMSKTLVLDGIDINAIDINKESALFRAIKATDTQLISFLLSSKVDPNIQNKKYQTALFEAVYQGIDSLDIILLLLRYGANPNLRNSNNETLYEVLNNIILHTHGKKELEDKFVLSKIKQDGQYILILKELLSHNKADLNYLDSNGEPLFFTPLLNDHFPLFKLYIKYGLNIQNVNCNNHNILFEYIYHVFKEDNENIDFQNNISMLLSAKLDHNFQDSTGYTVVHKILETKCNLNLFNILTQVILFDYTLTDNLGRSVAHTAVWHDQKMIIKKISQINKKVINIPDEYGILPITYAALLGSQELVLLFLTLHSNVKSGLNIPEKALKKFRPMIKNLDNLTDDIEDADTLRKIEILIDQVKRDFNIG